MARYWFTRFEIARVLVRLDHFVIAAWRPKEAESGPREVLGAHRGQSQETRLELGLGLGD
jgi:hypothetical protein